MYASVVVVETMDNVFQWESSRVLFNATLDSYFYQLFLSTSLLYFQAAVY